MAESKVKRDNFISLQGWMLTDLKLKGNELIIYACIYGFSQAESQVFSGSLQYLADWTNSTKQGVIKCLKSLVEKGYIVKNENIINGVKFCEYYATKFNEVLNDVEHGGKQSLTSTGKQSLPNTIDINNTDNNTGKEKKERKTSYDDILSVIEDESLKELYLEYIKMRKMIKSPMTDRALTMLIKKVNELEPHDIDRQKRMLETAIMNNWKSVYPLKDEAPTYRNNQYESGNPFYDMLMEEREKQ